MAIHLDLTLPPDSSSLPEDAGEQPNSPLLGLAPDEACHATGCYQRSGGLLHRRFTLTRRYSGKAVCSLLRYLSGHPGRTLSAIVLCGARKFLSPSSQWKADRDHQEVSQNSQSIRRFARGDSPAILLRTSASQYEYACGFGYNGHYPDAKTLFRHTKRVTPFEHKGGPHGYRRYRTSHADQAKVP